MTYIPPIESDNFNSNPQLQIEVHAGPLAGKGFPFTGNVMTFGRATDNDIALDDAQVSRYHAVLRLEGNELILEDLDSMNGVQVNGESIPGRHILQPTETITIGSSVFGVTGFSAPSTVSMSAQSPTKPGVGGWSTYQSGTSYEPQTSQRSSNWLLWSGLLLLVILIIAIAGLSFLIFDENQNTPAPAIPPSVIISSPVAGSQFQLGQRVIIQATGTDASSGVVRLELWIGGSKQAESTSPVSTGQSPFTAVMEWTPNAEGDYALEIRAFNAQGERSAPTLVNITVQAGPDEATPQPVVEETPTAVESGIPTANVGTDLNVRSGPGTNFPVVGLLVAGSTAEIVGQNDNGSWWYIVYPNAGDQRGWIAAEFAPSDNAADVPVANTPTPLPTATPTDTPTPTPTPILPTDTPTPTATFPPISIDPVVTFFAKPLEIIEGQCTTFTWLAANVQSVFFEDEGVPGENNGLPITREVCPTNTKTYTLRVIKLGNQEQIEQVEITVLAKPTTPEFLTIVEVLTTSLKLEWHYESDDQAEFRAYNADTNTILATFVPNVTAGEITELTCETTYRLYLVAYREPVGESLPSNIVTDATLGCP